MSGPIEITSVKQWNDSLRSGTATGKTVVVDFHATWCGPCKQIAPVFKTLAQQNPHVIFLRVDVDKLQPISAKYKVSAMPTFLTIKSGQVIDTLKGADPAGLTRMVTTHRGPNPPVAPLSPDAESAKGAANELFKSGRYPEALEAYSKAIQLAPESFTLLGNRSLTYLKLSEPQPDLALADGLKAVEIAPTWGKGWVRVGEAHAAGDKWKEAAEAFEKAAQNSEGTVQKEAKQKLAAAKAKLGWH